MIPRIRHDLLLVLFWLTALALAIGSYALTNDHFGRISPARQIAVYGELPFRDFLDPGYYLTELSSAALQRLLGDNLLGELLLNTAFVATGGVCVLLLVRRVSGSTLTGCVAAAIAQLSFPRAYDYDKVLFYPLGLLVLWRYLEDRRPGRLIVLAATIVIAGLFRYDNGVYLGIAALAGIFVRDGIGSTAFRRSGALIGLALMLTCPFLLLIHFNGGLTSAVDQMLTYGVRERSRTRLSSLPRIAPGRWIAIDDPVPGARITIQWSPGFDANGRADSARRLGLSGEALENREAGTWSYAIDDESSDHLRHIVEDVAVEATQGIDLQGMRLKQPTSGWDHLVRRQPILRAHLLPDFWSEENAAAVLFYVFVGLPIIAVVTLVLNGTSEGGPLGRATVSSLVTLTLFADVFVLRDPIAARAGGMAGLPIVLLAWLVTRLTRGRTRVTSAALWVVATATVLIVLTAFSVTGSWSRLFAPFLRNPTGISATLKAMATTPPDLRLLPTSRDEALVTYVRRCTLPADRVFATWFFPELYWFTQRGFSGEMVVMFGHHWSEPRFQERTVRALQSQPVPIVLVRNYADLRDYYPSLDEYLTSHYRLGGVSNFGDASLDSDAYLVFVSTDRPSTRMDPLWGLPCFT